MLRAFGFESFAIYLSTRPQKSIGSDDIWQRSQAALRQALDASGLPWQVDEGGGAFYGPKIDIKIRDALGRAWQCTTIQVDLNLPDRFEMTYVGADGERHRPIMIHRALLGSLERFFGVLLEHYAGAFPLWLAPEQLRVLPITERQHEYANRVRQALRSAGLRAEIDLRNEKLGYKIREGRLEKIPYLVVVGDREAEAGRVAPRERSRGDLGAMSLEDFLGHLREEARMPQVPQPSG
jgi:threonyl-tRNA synthetase